MPTGLHPQQLQHACEALPVLSFLSMNDTEDVFRFEGDASSLGRARNRSSSLRRTRSYHGSTASKTENFEGADTNVKFDKGYVICINKSPSIRDPLPLLPSSHFWKLPDYPAAACESPSRAPRPWVPSHAPCAGSATGQTWIRVPRSRKELHPT